MKNSTQLIVLALSLTLLTVNSSAQNVGINSIGATPNSSSILDVSSTQQGLLIPRMTDAQRQTLKDPATGLLLFNITTNELNVYNGVSWQRIQGNSVSTTSATGTSPGKGIAINTSGNVPDASSMLDVSSTSKGLLIPRTIPSSLTPVTGLICYNTVTNQINYYNGSIWIAICSQLVDNTKGTGAIVLGVAINATGATPDASAMLDIASSTKGFLFPRMTAVQRDAIKSPAKGLMIYDITNNFIEHWTGSAWNQWVYSAPAQPSIITGTSPVCQSQSGVTYSVTNVAGVTYSWTYSGVGFTCTSGCTTNAITVNFSAAATSGTLTCTPSNICGNGTSQTFAITVNTKPTGVTASATPNPICAGTILTLTGGATGATSWSWTGPNGFTSTLQSPSIANITTAGAGVYTLTASNTCGSVAPVSTASVVVSALPTTANAGLDITPACGVTTVTLAGNTPTVGTGAWSVVSGTATITTPSSPTSGVTGLAVPGTVTLQWTISNPPCTPSTDVVVITTSSCGPSCGTQVFAAANLNAGTQVNSTAAGSQQPSPYNLKYCYNNVAANCAIYGGLYEWDDVMLGAASVNCDPCGSSGVQGMCPAGYHIPTDLEWSRYEYCIENNIAPTGTTTLATFQTTVGWRGSTTAGVGPGDKMKVTSSNTPAWNGTNTSGFAALPAGYRNNGDGAFYDLGTYAYYWSATELSSTSAWSRILDTGNVQSVRINYNTTHGFSVRCLQN